MSGTEATQPSGSTARLTGEETQPASAEPRRRRRLPISAFALGTILGLSISVYLFAPIRTNVLVLGIDRSLPGTAAGRSDTMILTTCLPSKPYFGALSIPRDLWVAVPDGGYNRINTAHYFAEIVEPGSGPDASRRAVQENFGVSVHYTVRLKFDVLVEFIDALGGVNVHVEAGSSSYPAGEYELDGEGALAFARDRAGSDDFGRMVKGQVLVRAVFKKLLEPGTWPRLPAAASAILRASKADIPVWEWPRLLVCLIRVGPDRIDGRTFDRAMVRGFVTDQGAQVLSPQWGEINPLLWEMFSQ